MSSCPTSVPKWNFFFQAEVGIRDLTVTGVQTCALPIFLAVMWFYSPMLTGVVMVSLPLYALLSIAITPSIRARLHEKFNRGADTQSFLVEAISGIQTVKALAVEPPLLRKWEDQLAGYVRASFRATRV